jgi:phosphoglycerate kinase
MPKFKSIRDLSLAGKRVLMRVDFDVPQDKVTRRHHEQPADRRGAPHDQVRPRTAGAAVILMSHLGRPDGRKVAKFSLQTRGRRTRPVAHQAGEVPGRLRRARR